MLRSALMLETHCCALHRLLRSALIGGQICCVLHRFGGKLLRSAEELRLAKLAQLRELANVEWAEHAERGFGGHAGVLSALAEADADTAARDSKALEADDKYKFLLGMSEARAASLPSRLSDAVLLGPTAAALDEPSMAALGVTHVLSVSAAIRLDGCVSK